MLPLVRLRRVSALCLLTGLSWTSAAGAQVVQPNGTTVPANPAALSGYLNGSANNDNINEGIDVVIDAAIEPQVFSPLCDFSGKYIAKGGGANFAVGWYNADPTRPDDDPPLYVPVDNGANLNVAAAASDIHILFPFSSALPPPNMVDLSAVSIRQDPAYAGGTIGFVLVPNPNGTGNANATQYHYTEHRFNVNCTQCAIPGPWYSDLIYRSNELANTFYLGFEDLDFRDLAGAAGVNGNDLDYEDFLFRFTGVACPSAGDPCEVPGAMGVCANGLTDCDALGETICTGIIQPGSQAEECDGIDNDCDGIIDDEAPCPGNQVCHQGACVDPCSSGEFACGNGLVCQDDVCIDEDCVDVMCDAGEVCTDGACRAVCDGVVCPSGQVCIGDLCQDPCAGVTCDAGDVCLQGVCVTGCGCRVCGDGYACDTETDYCVEEACLDVECDPGTLCKAGECVPLCEGVNCPPGQQCVEGACEAIPPEMTTSTTGGFTTSSGGAGGAGGDASGGNASGGSDSGGAASGGGGGGTGDGSGCDCRIGDNAIGSGGGGVLAALALAAAGAIRRRRRSAATPAVTDRGSR